MSEGESVGHRTVAGDRELRAALSSLRREIRSRFPHSVAEKEAPSRPEPREERDFGLRFVRQRVSTFGMRESSPELDEFGMDPEALRGLGPWLDALFDRYWRIEVEGGLESREPLLLVANRVSLLPWDALMIAHAVERAGCDRPRLAVGDDWMTQPFVRPRLTRLGAVRACPENVERLLHGGRSVVVFPEGPRGAREAHKVERFDRGSTLRSALATGVPVVPVGVLDTEETLPLLTGATRPLRALGRSLSPGSPLSGLFGGLPLPSRWRIHFGEPFDLDGLGPAALRDELLLSRLSDQLRARVQELVDEAIRADAARD